VAKSVCLDVKILSASNQTSAPAQRKKQQGLGIMFGRVPGEKEGEAIKDVLRTYNPSKRLAEPLEIAKLAVYLASDDSAYVVGADFAIDGGAGAFSQLGA
jgi:NAD(P)-dependent dehydrogenase (short-subunit alcohol dehydrogenase family)